MNFSFWEIESWFKAIDFTVVGSGITGLNCALALRERFPKARILILEAGLLPHGASTRNAGFACFGSISEILDDLKTHSEEEVTELVAKRRKGLALLRKNLGDKALGYEEYGGYELFLPENKDLQQECEERLPVINELLYPVFEQPVFTVKKAPFSFGKVKEKVIYSRFEGQINTGKMMVSLLDRAHAKGIRIINGVRVQGFSDEGGYTEVHLPDFSFRTGKLLLATNGFAAELGIQDVTPARAQVLITKPIPDLDIKGTFHLDRGYYYFRNIEDRILLGGGRNLDFRSEETTVMEETPLIQDQLDRLLREVILPGKAYEVDRRWSGIMGTGPQKKPLLRQVSENVYCGVRLGGMGVAIGSLVGQELADLVS